MGTGNSANMFGKDLLPARWRKSNYMTGMKISANWATIAGITGDVKLFGQFDRYKWSMGKDLQMRQYGKQANGKYVLKFRTGGHIRLMKGFPADLNVYKMKNHEHKLDVGYSIDPACLEAPWYGLNNGCTTTGTVSGKYNNQRMRGAIRYRATNKFLDITGQFKLNKKGKNLKYKHNLRMFYKNHKYYELFWTAGAKGPRKLVLRVPGPKSFGRLQIVAKQYLRPVTRYFKMAANKKNPWKKADDMAHAVVWMDKYWETFTDELDCSALVTASRIESTVLAEHFEWTSVQAKAKELCVDGNEIALDFLKNTASTVVQEQRDYVHELTGSVGEAKHDEWFQTHFPNGL